MKRRSRARRETLSKQKLTTTDKFKFRWKYWIRYGSMFDVTFDQKDMICFSAGSLWSGTRQRPTNKYGVWQFLKAQNIEGSKNPFQSKVTKSHRK